MSLVGLLLDHPFTPDEFLLHTIDCSVTRGDVIAQAQAVAAELGDVARRAVAVQLPDGPDLVVAMFGIWMAGGVYVPVNVRHPKAEVDAIIEMTEPVTFINDSGLNCRVSTRVYADDVAFILWTSGTTGKPKPIQQTHAGYLEFLDRVLGPLRAAGHRTNDSANDSANDSGRGSLVGPTMSRVGGSAPAKRPRPNLIPVSMALNAGLYNALFGLRAGAELVIMSRFDCETFAELVQRFAIRSTVLPPAAIAMLNDSRITSLAPLAYVRSITAPLSPLQARRFMTKFGAFVLNGYGQAEIGEVIGWTAADARAHPEKIGAVGKPHPGVLIRINEHGNLLVKPPSAASGIEDRIDADGYLDTGDLGRLDDDGFVWIEGRSSDLINRGGNKVFPDAVEEVLRLSSAVDDVAVVGVSDDRLGEVPVAFLVGRPIPDDELIALCREHLVAYKVPAAFHWVERLPRSEVGKLLRRELLEYSIETSTEGPERGTT